MTAKEAIKLKCKDCYDKKGECPFPECPLFGLKNSAAGCNRNKAIRDYCRWCRKDLPYWVCTSPECPVYKYLKIGSET